VTGVLRHHWAFWMAPSEARAWLESAVAAGRPAFERGEFSGNPAVFIRGLIGLGYLSGIQGDVNSVSDTLQEAKILAAESGDTRLMVGASVVGGLRVVFQPTPEGIQELEEAIRLSREQGFRTELYFALGTLGYAYMLQGKTQKGATLVKEGARIAKAIGNPMGEAVTLAAQAGIARYSGDLESAKELQLEVIDHYEAVGHVAGVNTARSALAHILRDQEKFEEAREVYAHSILAWQEQGQLPAVAHQLECFAYMEMADERYEKAARLLGAAAALREHLKAESYDPRENAERESALARLGQELGEPDRDRIISQGRSLDIDAAIALAIGESDHDDS
jgi:tetratricopeptide (TPR) repeat protein